MTEAQTDPPPMISLHDLTGRHPGVRSIMRWFEAGHLPDRLQLVAGSCAELAWNMAATLPDGPELTAGLRKVLEAKDCFVRAELERTGERVIPRDAKPIMYGVEFDQIAAGRQLALLGTDAYRWARQFTAHAERQGPLDPGTVLAWFANAIQAGYDAAWARYDRHPEPEAAGRLIREAVGRASMCWIPGTGEAEFDSAEAARVATDLMQALGFDPPESPVRVADPRNGTERPEDALRRYAGQLDRLVTWFREHPEVPWESVDEDDPMAAVVTATLECLDQGLQLSSVVAELRRTEQARLDAVGAKLEREMRDLGLIDEVGAAPAGTFPLEAGERTEDAVSTESDEGEVTDR